MSGDQQKINSISSPRPISHNPPSVSKLTSCTYVTLYTMSIILLLYPSFIVLLLNKTFVNKYIKHTEVLFLLSRPQYSDVISHQIGAHCRGLRGCPTKHHGRCKTGAECVKNLDAAFKVLTCDERYLYLDRDAISH